jgi:hypothetical protein
MSRKPEKTKHPAIRTMGLTVPQTDDIDKLEKERDWGYLKPEHKHFLAAYSYYGDMGRAADSAGVSLTWVEEATAFAPFNFFLQVVKRRPQKVAEEILQDSLPWSARMLNEMVGDKANRKTQLDAIKHLHAVTGMMQQDPVIGQGAFLGNININMFGETPKRVEVEGKVVKEE